MSAVPNAFEFVIAEALDMPGATAESVAAAVASSAPFLKAIQLGMSHQTPSGGVPSVAQVVRGKLAKAFSAPTSGTMF